MTGVTGVVLTYCGIAMPFDDAIQELPKVLPHRYPGGAHTRRTGGAIVCYLPHYTGKVQASLMSRLTLWQKMLLMRVDRLRLCAIGRDWIERKSVCRAASGKTRAFGGSHTQAKRCWTV